MDRSRGLSQQVLAILSDGAQRSAAVIAGLTAASVPEILGVLAELEAAGLPLQRLPGGQIGLAAAFVALDAASIHAALAAMRCEADVEIAAIIDSTNAALLRRARADPAAFALRPVTVLAAELQTAGRGRQGRSWSAQAGSSLAVSFACQVPRGLGQLGGLSLMCGLAVRDALSRIGTQAQLKWPNDLLSEGRKVGGILIEVHPAGPNASTTVIGVGINVAPEPTRSAAVATAGGLAITDLISAGASHPVDRNRLIASLVETLSVRLEQFLGAGFGPYASDWNAHHAYRDHPVELLERGSVVHAGIARGVDGEGRLCLDTDSGTLTLVAGDISLRPRRAS
jgi:BirA family biotin operon repressor/biotin-[acetyl-CoA-carboxylase] ligase